MLPLRDHIDVGLVFGSIARGAETANSDIDLLLIGNAGFADVIKVLYPAQATLQREINPVILTPAEFVQRVQANAPFIREILRQPKLFVAGTEYDLGKLVGDPQTTTV